jgi:coatomer protein complex subunit alpha (xenin)
MGELTRLHVIQGKLAVVEEAYQRTESFDRLSFLYLITGQLNKLRNMSEISRARGDAMSQFQNALYLGDVVERINVLKASGQTSLAYVTAVSHGLEVQAQELAQALPPDQQLVSRSTHQLR